MSYEQLAEWLAYLTRIGTEEWNQSATVAQQVNGIAASFAGGECPELSDFIPIARETQETGEEDKLSSMGRALDKAFGNGNNR